MPHYHHLYQTTYCTKPDRNMFAHKTCFHNTLFLLWIIQPSVRWAVHLKHAVFTTWTCMSRRIHQRDWDCWVYSFISPSFQEKRGKTLNFPASAASPFCRCRLCFAQWRLRITLSVFVSRQPGALSILLWQWNSDDEPCLQGALPQGQPRTNTTAQEQTLHHTHTHQHTWILFKD